MPSLLSKISRSISRKKDDNNNSKAKPSKPSTPSKPPSPSPARTSKSSHLPPPLTSPSRSTFSAATLGPRSLRSHSKSEDPLQPSSIASFFRPNSPTPSSPKQPVSPPNNPPFLDLKLSLTPTDSLVPTDGDDFAAVFAAASRGGNVSEDMIDERRLTPEETERLVKQCAVVIRERGLETLGLFHPFWLSSSKTVQHHLISVFLNSLTPSSAKSDFDSELRYAQSPSDVAAVLKWGVRHLELQNKSLGKPSSNGKVDSWAWYRTFSEYERVRSYPLDAFSTSLVPAIPSAHASLLNALLDLFSTVAAHGEGNGMFNTKLSKVLAWWIVSGGSESRSRSGYADFYAEWERCARVVEHVFLAYLRDQSRNSRNIPSRLLELLRPYPPSRSSIDSAASEPSRPDSLLILPKPRLTSRTYDALLVRIQTFEGSLPDDYEKVHPTLLLTRAFGAKWDDYLPEDEYVLMWEGLKSDAVRFGKANGNGNGATGAGDAGSEQSAPATSSRYVDAILADTTIRLLSLVPSSTSEEGQVVHPSSPSTPTIALHQPTPSFRRRRSFSFHDADIGSNLGGRGLGVLHEDQSTSSPPIAETHNKAASSTSLVSSARSDGSNDDDWNVFSSAGFTDSPAISTGPGLAQSLFNVLPPNSKSSTTSNGSRKSSFGRSPIKRKPPPLPPTDDALSGPRKPKGPATFTTQGVPAIVPLDEAFIDAWADALLDGGESGWPGSFGVYQLKEKRGTVEWLVIEQSIVPLPPLPTSPSISDGSALARAPSPVASQKSGTIASYRMGRASIDTNATGATTAKKRFSFFSRTGSEATSTILQGHSPATVKNGGPEVDEMGLFVGSGQDRKTNTLPLSRVKSKTLNTVRTKSKADIAPSDHAPLLPEVVTPPLVLSGADVATTLANDTSSAKVPPPDVPIPRPEPAVPIVQPITPVQPVALAKDPIATEITGVISKDILTYTPSADPVDISVLDTPSKETPILVSSTELFPEVETRSVATTSTSSKYVENDMDSATPPHPDSSNLAEASTVVPPAANGIDSSLYGLEEAEEVTVSAEAPTAKPVVVNIPVESVQAATNLPESKVAPTSEALVPLPDDESETIVKNVGHAEVSQPASVSGPIHTTLEKAPVVTDPTATQHRVPMRVGAPAVVRRGTVADRIRAFDQSSRRTR